jgi:hypothetical protein
MNRRHFLTVTGTATALATAGCLGGFETETQSTGRTPPLVENRPDAVYVPSHIEGMEMAGMGTDGRYKLGLSYSFPHRFWRTTADRTNKVDIRDADTVHLMVTAWDGDTGTVVPSSAATVTASKDGETVLSEKRLWSMLSQNMGVHFGDNVELAGDGTYEVTIDFGPIQTQQTGGLADALSETASATVEMDFAQSALEEVMYERLDDRKGDRDAVDPMEMEMMPGGQVPTTADLPGEVLGEGRSGDGVFVATALDSVPAGVDGEGTYLALSARTPYNRYPLPFMSLSATLSREGTAVFEGDLTDALHPDLGYHYGAVVDGVQSGDELSVSVDAVPQIARHEGYETAFLAMDDVTLSV